MKRIYTLHEVANNKLHLTAFDNEQCGLFFAPVRLSNVTDFKLTIFRPIL